MATIQPKPAIEATAQGVPLLPTTPGPCDLLAVSIAEAPPLDTGGDSLADTQRPPVIGGPPEPVAVPKHLVLPPDVPEQNMLLMVAPSAPVGFLSGIFSPNRDDF